MPNSAVPEPTTRLLSAWSAEVTTRSGVRLYVRPVSQEDEEQVRAFYASLSPDDLRFRFLTALVAPSQSLLESLVDVDHVRTEDFLAFADNEARELVATAMLAADPAGEEAEVAIAVRPDYRDRGVGWALLDFVAHDAAARGIHVLKSIECRDNRATIALEHEMGFTASPYPGDGTLTLLSKRLEPRRPGGTQ